MSAKGVGKNKGVADERYKALIALLRNRRLELALTQAALGDRLGNHQQFVARFELGERRLDVVEFLDVAEALQLDAGELVRAVIRPNGQND